MNHYQARSKGTWGREEAKSAQELNRLCNEFFEKLVVPEGWKDMGWSNATDPDTQVLYSVGKAFRDTRTSGQALMHYRIYFNSFSGRGGICEKSIIDFGKYGYKCIGHGIFTIEKLNDEIANRYNEIKKEDNPSASLDLLQGDIDKDDGLQHFRDRFGTGVVNDI